MSRRLPVVQKFPEPSIAKPTPSPMGMNDDGIRTIFFGVALPLEPREIQAALRVCRRWRRSRRWNLPLASRESERLWRLAPLVRMTGSFARMRLWGTRRSTEPSPARARRASAPSAIDVSTLSAGFATPCGFTASPHPTSSQHTRPKLIDLFMLLQISKVERVCFLTARRNQTLPAQP